MPTPVRDKYFLRSLHQEIALFDRKLAHLHKHEVFPTDYDRDTAAQKMSAKRDLLVRTARELVSNGIAFNPADLPPSLREDEPAAATDPALAASAEEVTEPVEALRPAAVPDSPYAGTALDYRADLLAYKQRKLKV